MATLGRWQIHGEEVRPLLGPRWQRKWKENQHAEVRHQGQGLRLEISYNNQEVLLAIEYKELSLCRPTLV